MADKNRSPLALAKQYCFYDFVERNVKKSVALLSRDITWFGTGQNEDVKNREEAKTYLLQEIQSFPHPYVISFSEENEKIMGEGIGYASLKLHLKAEDLTFNCRLTAVTCMEDGESRLCSLHLSSPTAEQQEDEYFPFTYAREKEKQIQQDLLNHTVAGGIIACYHEPGLPLYFINSRMLEYLGYTTEEEFFNHTEGHFLCCVHPDDRLAVQSAMDSQREKRGEFSLEFRMKTQNDSYLWMHLTGRFLRTEDNRVALISACHDITPQKIARRKMEENARQMENIINSIPGGVAIYKVSDRFETVYFSDGIPALSGHTVEEYHELIKSDAAEMVYEGDVERVVREVREGLEHNRDIDITFRKTHTTGKLVWVHLQGKKIGEQDGFPLLHAVFHNISKETELYQDILDESETAIYVCDLETKELLYTNLAGFRLAKKEPFNFSGQPCYKCMMDRDTPCDFCKVTSMSRDAMLTDEVYVPQFQRHASLKGKITTWQGRDAYIEYVVDITTEKNMRRSLENAKTELECIINSIPGGICVFRWDGRELTPVAYNAGFCVILGVSQERVPELYSKNNYASIHPDDLEMIKRETLEAYRQNGIFRCSYRCFNEEKKEYHWIYAEGSTKKDSTGILTAYVNYTDITAQKETEHRLYLSEKSLSTAIDHANIQYWEYDMHTDTAYISGKSMKNGGMDERIENFSEKISTEGYAHPDFIEIYRNALQSIRSGAPKATFDARLIDPRGEYVWLRIRYTCIFDENDKAIKAIATAEDIDAYKELEIRFSTAAAQVGMEVWVYDVENHSIIISSPNSDFTLCQNIENAPENLITLGIVHPDDAEILYDFHRRLETSHTRISARLRMRNQRTKTWAYHETLYTPIFDKKDRLVRAVGTAMNITELMDARHRYQEAVALQKLTAQKAVSSFTLNLSTDQIVEYHTDLSLFKSMQNMRCSEFFEASLSYLHDEESKRIYSSLYTVENLLKRYDEGILSDCIQIKYTLSHGNTAWFSIPVTLMKHPESNDIIAFTYVEDITAEKILSDLVRYAGSTVFDLMMHINAKTGSLVAYSHARSEPMVKNDYDQFLKAGLSNDDRKYRDLNTELVYEHICLSRIVKELERKKEYTFTTGATLNNGSPIYWNHSFSYLDETKDAIAFIRTNITDIHFQEMEKNRELTSALALAHQANEAKSTFLSAMSHDIRTPMNAIIGMTKIAQDNIKDSAQVKESLNIIENSSAHLLSIINDLLDMSRLESGKMVFVQEPFDLMDLLDRTKALFQRQCEEKGLILTMEKKNLQHVDCRGDKQRLLRVLENVLGNAVKFTASGKVHFLIEELPSDKKDMGQYLFEISDTGMGMTSEQISHIFEPFYRTGNSGVDRIEGTGLGLSIVKSIVEAKDGIIKVKSTPGKGSVFTLILPLKRTGHIQPASPSPNTAPPVNLKDLHILLVEDHPINTLVVRRLLEKQGARIDTAENGQLGYDAFTSSSNGEYDLIFMDIQMPVMNGYEASMAIRQSPHPQAKSIPIIAMTANAFTQDEQKSFSSGMNGHVTKPISMRSLSRKMSVNRKPN